MNTHDFRRPPMWGYAMHSPVIKGKQLKASCHTPWRMQKGDEVLWATGFGYCVAEVTKAEGCRDPYDMYFFTAKVKRRVVTVEVADEQRRSMRGFEFAA